MGSRLYSFFQAKDGLTKGAAKIKNMVNFVEIYVREGDIANIFFVCGVFCNEFLNAEKGITVVVTVLNVIVGKYRHKATPLTF